MLPIRYGAISRTDVGRVRHRELPVQVLLEALRPRERVLERDLLRVLVLARVVRAVEVVLEVGVEVDLVEGVALLLDRRSGVRGRSGRRSPPSFAAAPPRLRPRSACSAELASSSSSSRGFSTTSWVRTSCSSSLDICRSLIACCSDGVMTSRCESRRLSFCSSAIEGAGRLAELKCLPQIDLFYDGVTRQGRGVPARKISPAWII